MPTGAIVLMVHGVGTHRASGAAKDYDPPNIIEVIGNELANVDSDELKDSMRRFVSQILDSGRTGTSR